MSNAFVPWITSFVNLLTNMVSSVCAFGVSYHVSFLNARTNYIVDNMISSDIWSSDRQLMYARYIRVTSLERKEAQFSYYLKSGVKKVLEQEAWESHMWKIPRSRFQTRLAWNWCFKPLILLSKFQRSLFRSILCHSTSLHITFCRTFNRLIVHVQDVLLFPFLISWSSKSQFIHPPSFLLWCRLSIRWTYSVTILVKEPISLSHRQSHAIIICSQKAGRNKILKRTLQSGQLSLR